MGLKGQLLPLIVPPPPPPTPSEPVPPREHPDSSDSGKSKPALITTTSLLATTISDDRFDLTSEPEGLSGDGVDDTEGTDDDLTSDVPTTESTSTGLVVENAGVGVERQ